MIFLNICDVIKLKPQHTKFDRFWRWKKNGCHERIWRWAHFLFILFLLLKTDIFAFIETIWFHDFKVFNQKKSIMMIKILKFSAMTHIIEIESCYNQLSQSNLKKPKYLWFFKRQIKCQKSVIIIIKIYNQIQASSTILYLCFPRNLIEKFSFQFQYEKNSSWVSVRKHNLCDFLSLSIIIIFTIYWKLTLSKRFYSRKILLLYHTPWTDIFITKILLAGLVHCFDKYVSH